MYNAFIAYVWSKVSEYLSLLLLKIKLFFKSEN